MPVYVLPRSSRALLLLLATPLVLAACAQDEAGDEAPPAATESAAPAPAPAAAAPARDVCKMISAEELKTATGVEGEGTVSTSGGADVCTWFGADGKAAIVQVYPSESSYEDSREAFEDFYKGKSEALSGVGDRAFYIASTSGPATATISAMKGSKPITAQIMGAGDAAALKSDAVKLANLVLSKM